MSGICTVLLWIFIILFAWFLFVEVVVRIVRRYIQFPIPAFVARFIDNPIRRRIQPPARVIDWMGIGEGMCILEIGPGPGTFTMEAARRVGGNGEIFAIDIQPAVISKLDARLRRERIANVTAEVADAYVLPYQDRTFDRVFMVAVLGEIPDRKRALLQARRVLKDGGLLAIGEFLPDPDYPRRRTVTGWCQDAGFELQEAHGGALHYVLTFKKHVAASPIPEAS